MAESNHDKKWIGQRFSRLTVIDIKPPSKNRREWRWVCQCDCGNIITVAATSIKSGNTKSCGCLKNEKSGLRFRKFENKITENKRLYEILSGMKKRCYNEKSPRYKDYGGRGIEICDEWMDSERGFDSFVKWSLENGYNEIATIDRIDVDGDYEPSNCRWVTLEQQANNKRDTVWVDYNGEHIQLLALCKKLGISYGTVYQRIFKRGWGIEKAIETPSALDTSFMAKCREAGINYCTARDRIMKLGWTEEEALNTPSAGRGANISNYGKSFPPKKCKVCGKEFIPKISRQVYCGEQCKAASKRVGFKRSHSD